MSCLEKVRNNGIDLGNEFTAEWITVIQFKFRTTITTRSLLVSKPDATVKLHMFDLKSEFLMRQLVPIY